MVAEGEAFLDGILGDDECYAPLPRQYEVILDKTGLTGVQDFPRAYAVLKKIHEILSPQGCYIYIASHEFYNRHYGDREK